MKKTKHFNISVPELGDVPDITQVSNAISDLEDATAGTLEIMKAEMQGTKITLTSVSRKTKRTGYYEGMSIRFKSPQDIEPNYLKTISVDGLGDQTLTVEYKVNRNEYIDIVYEGNKFTAYPVVVQKTDSVSENSSILVGTAKGVKTAYDKGVEALNKANQAQSSADSAQTTADGKVSKNGDTMNGTLNLNSTLALKGIYNGEELYRIGNDSDYLYIQNRKSDKGIRLYNNGNTEIKASNLTTSAKEVVAAINELNSGKENKIDKKSGFNLDKSDSVASNSSNTIATSLAVKTAYDKGVEALNKANQAQSSANKAQLTADGKVSKSGDTVTGVLKVASGDGSNYVGVNQNNISFTTATTNGRVTADQNSIYFFNETGGQYHILRLSNDGTTELTAKNLKTNSKEVISAINNLNDEINKKADTDTLGRKIDNRDYSADLRDLNTMKKDGFYSGYRWANAPVVNNVIACLDVKKYTDDWVVQVFYAMNTDGLYGAYQRAFFDGTGWSEWVAIVTDKSKVLVGLIGNEINYIQQPGVKTPDKIYIDTTTKKLYRPLSNTSDTQVTQNFRVVSILDNSNGIGFGQKYKKVGIPKDSRQTNNTGRPIFYSVTDGGDGSIQIFVDDIQIANFSSVNNDSPTSFIVPDGSTWYWTGSNSYLVICELS